MPGLDYPLAGDDAWLGWFSLVASHSDAVIFIERTSTGLTCGQLREAAVISDRVPMKIVPMTDDQLGHVGGEHPKGEVHRIVPGEGFVTKKRMDEIESASTREHLNRYIDRGAYRADRMHVVDQSGRTRQYPLDHPMYGHLPLITDTNAQFGPPRLPAELDFLRFLMPDLFNG